MSDKPATRWRKSKIPSISLSTTPESLQVSVRSKSLTNRYSRFLFDGLANTSTSRAAGFECSVQSSDFRGDQRGQKVCSAATELAGKHSTSRKPAAKQDAK